MNQNDCYSTLRHRRHKRWPKTCPTAWMVEQLLLFAQSTSNYFNGDPFIPNRVQLVGCEQILVFVLRLFGNYTIFCCRYRIVVRGVKGCSVETRFPYNTASTTYNTTCKTTCILVGVGTLFKSEHAYCVCVWRSRRWFFYSRGNP